MLNKKPQPLGRIPMLPKKPYEEFQIDIFYIRDLDDQDIEYGLLIIDIFTKFLTVVPLVARAKADISVSLNRGLREMGGNPDMIYSDNEPSQRYMDDFFKNRKITYIPCYQR